MKLFRIVMRTSAAFAALAVGVLFASSAHAEWGTIKGQVVWANGPVPKNEKANVDKDKADCLVKGNILQNKVVVNPKNKGVRWVLVWLADPADARNVDFVPPIHPSLKTPKPSVEIDQPCCTFEPRVIGMLASQNLIVKNSMKIPHNVLVTSIGKGPQVNDLIPGKGQAKVSGFVPKFIPTPYSCSIHPWMKGYIGTFAHPYFTVTDADGKFEIKNAPVGKFRLVFWQEEVGFVVQKGAADRGKVIEVKEGATTDVKNVDFIIPKDD